ncbi:MAG TPA: cysteine peptidase family C39 domain-containing protein [Magnetospirillaceae bacterium]|nr:cysteine peptidase family C39 domain-containing protein [Magnetospirillaceae bacterium]
MKAFLLALALSCARGKEALRFEQVHEQAADFSCGLAAAASLADLYWGVPCSEADLRDALAPEGDLEERATDLAELGRLLEGLGFSVRAVRMEVEGLRQAVRRGYAPLLLHLRDDGGHFVLLLGFRGETAVLGDPGRGVTALRSEDLKSRFTGGVLAVVSPSATLDRDRLDAAVRSAASGFQFLEALSRRML